ncbi:hypothetical protein DFH06DRAFT_968647 [Mycena polygramma]|nr:hypothetical protein DFH06DRAFT_968647 [Mycena polygramma]
MDVDTQTSEARKVPELWFEDGNLVIQAGNSLYRVYRGFLATHSVVFADMLGLPQPADSELVDGCPFVRIPDLEAEVTPFFKAMFVPDFFMPFPASTDSDAVVGCLRLSHKYGVDYLHRRALVHFASGYPTTLHELDSTIMDLGYNAHPPDLKKQSWRYPDDPAFKIRAIQVARQVDATWILPWAFYALSVTYPQLGTAIFHGTTYKGVHTELSLQDQASFLTGHDVQRTATSVNVLQCLSYPFAIEGCLDPTQCIIERTYAIERSRGLIRDYPSSALYFWDSAEWDRLEDDLCPRCGGFLREMHYGARNIFWNELPEMYDLPPWRDLEKMKATAIGAEVSS